MRLIDADALEKEMCSGCEYNKNKYANCDDCVIANAPTIDAVPVVRCKDCDRGFGSPVCPIQIKDWAINKDTFFCAWGEREES